MLEMRYLVRQVKYQPHELNKTEKVLQYRYRNSSAKYGNGAKVWSEWIDVPTVKEE